MQDFIDEVYANTDLSLVEQESIVIDKALQDKVPVRILYNNETGTFQWSVVIDGTDFWLDSFKFKDDAIDFCTEEGLPVLEIV